MLQNRELRFRRRIFIFFKSSYSDSIELIFLLSLVFIWLRRAPRRLADRFFCSSKCSLVLWLRRARHAGAFLGSLFVQRLIVHFFCPSKRNEPKKRRPETISLSFRCACYTGLIGATLQAKLRAVSGLPPHLEYYTGNIYILPLLKK